MFEKFRKYLFSKSIWIAMAFEVVTSKVTQILADLVKKVNKCSL